MAALSLTVKHSLCYSFVVFDRYSFISSIHSTIYLKKGFLSLCCFVFGRESRYVCVKTKVPVFTDRAGWTASFPFIKAQIFLSLLNAASKEINMIKTTMIWNSVSILDFLLGKGEG